MIHRAQILQRVARGVVNIDRRSTLIGCNIDRLGSIVVDEEKDAVPVTMDYGMSGVHPYHIVAEDFSENFGNGTIDWVIYWMPTYGYCARLAALFHYMVERNLHFRFTKEDFDMFRSVVRMIDKPQYFGTDDSYTLDGVRILASCLCQRWGVAPPERDEPFGRLMQQFQMYGIPLAEAGKSGVVFTRRGKTLHCGYKCHYVPPKDWAEPKAWCTEQLLIDSGLVVTDYREFISATRCIYGGDDKYVEVNELISYLKYKRYSHNLYFEDHGVIQKLASDTKYSPNALVKGLLSKEHWTVYKEKEDIDSFFKIVKEQIPVVDKNEKKKKVSPDEEPGWAIDQVEYLDWVVLINPDQKTYKLHGEKFYFNGQVLVHYKNKFNTRLAATWSDEDHVSISGVKYLVDEVKDFEFCRGVTVVVEDMHVNEDYDDYGFSFKYRSQTDPSDEHDVAMTEFCLLSDKYRQMKQDLMAVARAAKLYIMTTTKKSVPMDWVVYRLVRFIREQESYEKDLRFVAEGAYWKRYLTFNWKKWFLRGLIGIFFSRWFRWILIHTCLSWGWCLLNLLCEVFPFYSVLNMSLWLSIFIFLFYFYGNMKHIVDIPSALRVGRMDQDLSYDKLAELYIRDHLPTASLDFVKCWWMGHSVSFYRLIQFMRTKLYKPQKPVVVSKLVPQEWENWLHKLAPSTYIGGLWAFIIRASTPMAVP